MFYFLFTILISTLSLSTHVHAESIDFAAWGYVTTFAQEEMVLDNTNWYVASINPSIWSKSLKSDYGDIRIISATNEEIPYVLVKQGAVIKPKVLATSTNSKTKIIENIVQDSEKVIVIDTNKEGLVYTGLNFKKNKTSQNFRKRVRVYISDTLLRATSPRWKEIEKKDIVYNYTDATGQLLVEDLDITFPNMSSRYIKVAFEDNQLEGGEVSVNQIQIDEVFVQYDSNSEAVGTTIKNYMSGSFNFPSTGLHSTANTSIQRIENIEENADTKNTEIYINNVQAITGITLAIDKDDIRFDKAVTVQGSFDNTSWQTVTTGRIYRIDSSVYQGDSLTIQTPVITYPYLQIIVENKNEKPLRFDRDVILTAQKIGILFKAEGVDIQSLKFLIGNREAVTPAYDISKTLVYMDSIVPAQVSLQSISANSSTQEGVLKTFLRTQDNNLVHALLVVFVVLLGYLGYTWTRK